MTAMNVLVQKTAAHILTDGALYNDEGIIMEISSKALVSDANRMIVMPSGRATSRQLLEALIELGVEDQTGGMKALPGIAETIRLDNVRNGPAFEPDLQLFAIIWSDIADMPEAWALSTNRSYFGEQYRLGTWAPITGTIGMNTDIPALLSRQVDLADADSFHPERDGLTLLEHQRSIPWDDGGHYIGGGAHLHSVDREGARTTVLNVWPDVVGERVKP